MSVDWGWIGATFTWAAGLSLVLAVLSFAWFRSTLDKVSLRSVFAQKSSLFAADCGALIFLAGVWMTGAPLAHKLFWTAGTAWLTVETWLAWQRKKKL